MPRGWDVASDEEVDLFADQFLGQMISLLEAAGCDSAARQLQNVVRGAAPYRPSRQKCVGDQGCDDATSSYVVSQVEDLARQLSNRASPKAERLLEFLLSLGESAATH